MPQQGDVKGWMAGGIGFQRKGRRGRHLPAAEGRSRQRVVGIAATAQQQAEHARLLRRQRQPPGRGQVKPLGLLACQFDNHRAHRRRPHAVGGRAQRRDTDRAGPAVWPRRFR